VRRRRREKAQEDEGDQAWEDGEGDKGIRGRSAAPRRLRKQ